MRSPRKRRATLSMTSLIDVIFLLLLFFMLSSTISRFGEVKLSLGGAGAQTAAPDSKAQIILLRLTADGISLNGTPIETANARDAIAEQRGNSDAHLVVSVLKEASSETLVQLLYQARAIPDLKVTVVQ